MEFKICSVSAVELSNIYGTPLYVYNREKILEQIHKLKNAFPNTHICYAIKANSNLSLLDLISSQGLGADCSTKIELELAEMAGFDMSKSIFTSVNPTNEDLMKALECGVIINLDDISILRRLLKFGKPNTICFRINPGIGKGKFPGIICGGSGTKFGMSEEVALQAYLLAKERGINNFGVHMMTGSCVLHEEYFVDITRAILEIAQRIEEKAEIKLSFIDIGGGLGVPYEPHEKDLDIAKVGREVLSVFNTDAKLMIEPGRYIVADSGILLTKVTTIKNNFIGVDAGMTTLMRPALYGAYHPIILANNIDAALTQEVNIVGPICESTDFFAHDRPMPYIQEGDVLAILVAGAYSFSMASQFNGRLKPAEILVSGENHNLIRTRETVKDLVRNEVGEQ